MYSMKFKLGETSFEIAGPKEFVEERFGKFKTDVKAFLKRANEGKVAIKEFKPKSRYVWRMKKGGEKRK